MWNTLVPQFKAIPKQQKQNKQTGQKATTRKSPGQICVSPAGNTAKQHKRGRSHNQNTHTRNTGLPRTRRVNPTCHRKVHYETNCMSLQSISKICHSAVNQPPPPLIIKVSAEISGISLYLCSFHLAGLSFASPMSSWACQDIVHQCRQTWKHFILLMSALHCFAMSCGLDAHTSDTSHCSWDFPFLQQRQHWSKPVHLHPIPTDHQFPDILRVVEPF